MEDKDFVYVVMLEWVNSDKQSIDFYIYKDYDKAFKKLENLILNECYDYKSWVGSQVFNEHGEIRDGFTLDCNTDKDILNEYRRDLFWKVSDNYDCRYFNFTLTKKEIIGD